MHFGKLFWPRRTDDPAQAKISRLKDYQDCFSTAVGQRVLEDICRNGLVAEPLIMPGEGPVDPLQFALREGRRSLALDIAKWADSEMLAFRIEQRAHQQIDEGLL